MKRGCVEFRQRSTVVSGPGRSPSVNRSSPWIMPIESVLELEISSMPW